jgi:hypothetical protein
LRLGKPQMFNTDQSSQSTSTAFTGVLEAAGIEISMDGRGRWMDNVFIQWLLRSLKHEDVYLKFCADGKELRAGLCDWIVCYNEQLPHPGTRVLHPDGSLARRHRKLSCGHGGQRRSSVAHMPTASTTDADRGPRGLISENRSGQTSNQKSGLSGPPHGVHFRPNMNHRDFHATCCIGGF